MYTKEAIELAEAAKQSEITGLFAHKKRSQLHLPEDDAPSEIMIRTDMVRPQSP